MNRLKEERGQALIIVVLSLTCILGFVALATDVGILLQTKRRMQTAADSAAIAGAAELRYGNVSTAALAGAADNGVVNGSNGATVSVNDPPQLGPHAGDAAYVEVIATQNNPTFFMRAFHINALDVSARAVATLGSGNGCIYTLDPTGTGLRMNGSGNINVPDCGIVIDSSDSDAIRKNGSGTITAGSIGVVGGVNENGSGSITPTPVTGIAPAGDPLAFLSPPPYTSGSCLPNPRINGSANFTLGPSSSGGVVCYNGLSINGSGNGQLNPGVYVINGDFNFNGSGTLQGTGVTFYFPPGGSFGLNGSHTVDLSAPTSGAYNGVLFYQDPANHQDVTVNGSSSSVFTGIFYFPGAELTLNGSNSTTFNAAFVAGSIVMNGSGRFNNYASLNGSGPLTSARLVE